jgi:hypothetical protein
MPKGGIEAASGLQLAKAEIPEAELKDYESSDEKRRTT